MALSEHGFHAPKCFTRSPGLTTNTKQNLGTKTFQNVEKSEIVSQLAPQVMDRFRSTGGSDDMTIEQTLHGT